MLVATLQLVCSCLVVWWFFCFSLFTLSLLFVCFGVVF